LYQGAKELSFGSAAVAASMLLDGPKTSKLRRFFELHHQHQHQGSQEADEAGGDGNLHITDVALYELLTTIYRSIHFLSSRPYVNSTADRRAFLNIVTSLANKKTRLVSFSDFGDWYNEKGFNSIAWLEQLNAKKLCFF
jgi:hypothetical protein